MVVPINKERESILKLIDEKERIEQEIFDLGKVLRKNNIGMNDPLIISGFPRNDIDVYQIRHARHKIICLQNDLKTLLNSIEKSLESFHAYNKDEFNFEQVQKDLSVDIGYTKAIVCINNIHVGGPAYEARLKVFDEIVEFGSLNESNFESINQISEIVHYSQNKSVRVKLIRNGKFIETMLVPKTWAGNGLLGCTIMPL